MKIPSLLLVMIAFITGSAEAAMGRIDFRNGSSQVPDALVLGVDGNPLAGENYLAQLYFAADAANPSALAAVLEGPSFFRAPSTSVPGTWRGGGRTLRVVENGVIELIVRVWDSNLGDFAETVAAGGEWGQSEPFEYYVTLYPCECSYFMDNFHGLQLVPEPSALSVLLVGVAGLWLRHRRRCV